MVSKAAEAANTCVTYDDREYDVIKEGLAEILSIRKEEKPGGKETQQQTVFYNPIQQFNRDLSVLAIRAFAEDIAVIRKARHQRRLEEKGRKRKKQENGYVTGVSIDVEGAVQGGAAKSDITKKGDSSNGEINPHEIGVSANHIIDAVDEMEHPAPRNTSVESGQTNSNELGVGVKRKIGLVEEVEYPNSENIDMGDNHTNTNADMIHNEQLSGEPIEKDLNNSTQNPDTTDSIHDSQVPKKSNESQKQFTFDGVPKGPRETDVQPQKPRFRILDALSATGLRALRYAEEIPSVSSVTANDLSSSATASIELNVRHNELVGKIHPITGNALAHMYNVASNRNSTLPKKGLEKYDVIDLDPYGTAAPFLDAAVQAVEDGGLLCVTCTDSGVFASVGYLEKAFSQYGGVSFKGPQSHEAGLRLIVHAVAMSAARYSLAIEPLLSLSIDFYARVFVRIRKSPAEVKYLAGKTMIVYNCDAGCGAWTTQYISRNQMKTSKKGETIYKFSSGQAPSASPHCEHCGFKTHLAGPMWGGPLHNPHFIQRILDMLPSLNKEIYATIPRIEGMLSTALQETILDSTHDASPNALASEESSSSPFSSLNPASPDDYPFFIIPSVLSKVVHCTAPSDAAFRGALIRLGYRATHSHCKPGSIRTDAPWSTIWEVMREWIRQKAPVKEGSVKPGMPGWRIMQNDRSKFPLLSLKEELKAIIERASDLDKTKVEIEAALYRASKSPNPETSNGGKPNGISYTTGDTETSIEGKSPKSADSIPDPLRNSKLDIVFDERLGRERESKRMVRYQMNPRPNWGPMNRAKGHDT